MARIRIRSILRRLRRDSLGSSMLETALALVVALPLAFYGFELCMMTYTESVLADAARCGVRYAVVHGSDSTSCSGPSAGCADSGGSNVAEVVTNQAAFSFHDMSHLLVTVSYPDGASTPTSRVLITVAYTYVPYVDYAGLTQQLNATAEGTIVY